jgi:tetratricopeptide (TPR) repeat protein
MVAYILKKLIKIQTEGFDLLALALIMYLSPLFITSNIPFNIGAPMGERFLYIPSFGLLILVGALLQKYLKINQVKNLLGSVLLVGIALVFVGMTYSRNPVWYNNFTLFESDVEHAPNSAKMRFYYGNALLNKNINLPEAEQNKSELEAAVEQFKKAIEINPKFHHAYYDCANTYDQLQNGNEAFKYLRKSLDLQPNHIKSTMLIGKIYGRYLNNADSSIYYLNRYVNLFHQENATGYQFLGTAYAVKGSIEFQKTQQLAVAKPYFESALKYLESALKLDPENVDALANMSVVYMSLGDIPKAEEFKKRTNDLKLKKAKK